MRDVESKQTEVTNLKAIVKKEFEGEIHMIVHDKDGNEKFRVKVPTKHA